MGTKSPLNERPRRGGHKCEFCGRALPSAQALRSHQNTLHSSALKEKAKRETLGSKGSKVQKAEPRKPPPKKADTKGVSKQKDAPKTEKNQTTIETNTETKTKLANLKNGGAKTETVTCESDDKISQLPGMERQESSNNISSIIKSRKVEFKCPVCDRLFSILFSAQKHIEKTHKNELRSDVLQPITLEYCRFCDDKLPSPHVCPNRPKPGLALSYECSGCEEQFNTNKLFDIHVADVHGENHIDLFFPKDDEFISWKGQMEKQTECNYVILGQYNSKQIYRCVNIDEENSEAVRFCPSTIIMSKASKGIHINFYPKHYAHGYKAYKLTDKYKSYSVTDLIQQALGDSANIEDKDLYVQFQNLMETIVLDAAKINIDSLQLLMSKAKEMTSILAQYDEDEDLGQATSNFTKYTQAFDIPKTEDETSKSEDLRKRKIAPEVEETKAKLRKSVFSLADDKDSEDILKELDTEPNKSKNKRKSPHTVKDELFDNLKKSPSFNDTYKDFIDKTINVKKSEVNKNTKKPTAKKKTVMKTKMGQFKPSLSPKKDATKRTSVGKTKDIEYEVKERENDCNILILKL